VTAANPADRPPLNDRDAEQLDRIPVFLTVAVRTSGGNGPGVVRVPREEAARLVAARHGVHGEMAPRGFLDGGADGRVIGAMVPRLAPPGPE
jgi:hypothetical protein